MSDGVIERFNATGEFLGYERLSKKLQQIDPARLTAKDILEGIIQVGDEWAAGHPLRDDVTLVVMKVK
jgi:serine phosphatase RsbU (regulator of sigma subunit)